LCPTTGTFFSSGRRHADELRSGGGVAARHTPPPLHPAEHARLPPEEPATTPATHRGAAPSSHPRDRGTSHNGRALCAAPSASSGRSPRRRPSWLTYPVRRSSGGVEARTDMASAGILADGLAERRVAARGLPFCFGRPRTPPLTAAPRPGWGLAVAALGRAAPPAARPAPANPPLRGLRCPTLPRPPSASPPRTLPS
jgi:hypothetical protein